MPNRPPHRDFLDEWSHFLRRVPLFHDLELDDLKEIARRLQPLSLPKDATLYREGELADAMYIIQSGRVKATTPDEDGNEKVINFLGRGETLGETALLNGFTRSVTVKVDFKAHFLVLYKKDFESFLNRNPKAAAYLHRAINERLISHPKRPLYPTSSPEIIGFQMELEGEEQMAFLANLALSLKEQTRRRILLIELGPQGTRLIEALGLKPIASSSSMFHSEDLTNAKLLDKISVIHSASGLELLSLPLDIFSGSLQKAIPSFISVLHDTYDYVLLNVTQAANREIILKECDSFFYVHKGENTEIERITSQLPDISRSLEAILGPSKASTPTKFYVPWSPNGQTISVPHQTKKILDRIARAVGHIQVGFAMGSGAAYGYTLIGMLKVFEREKIPIDYISGTSMGSLLGAFSASGKSADEIEAIALTITKSWLRRNLIRDFNWRFLNGLIKGEAISKFLRKHLGLIEFEDLPTSFSCAATDIMSGDRLVMREGPVWEAVRASLSLPLIFTPYKRGDQFLVDGGLVSPVPTPVIASMGADILISANLTNKAAERRVSLRRVRIFPATSPGFLNVFFKMIYTMQYQIAVARSDISHVVIHPETNNFSWVDLHRAKQIIPLGEEAAEEALTKIKARLPYFADHCPVPQRTTRTTSY